MEFLKKVSQRKSKLIVVVISGSPLILDEVHELADAVLWTCYPGEEGGNGISDIIFGDVNPSGRLPITFPAKVEDLPPFEDYSMKGRTYRYMETPPQYPFGFGLSYTRFSYSNLILSSDSLSEGEYLTVTAAITNIGSREGEEVVQLYLTATDMPFRTPLLTLKDFTRVNLKPGETGEVSFTLTDGELILFDNEGREIRQPGLFRVFIAGAAPVARAEELGGSTPLMKEFRVL